MADANWQFPEVFAELFRPHRWKVFYGGRDGAKSWSYARYLLLKGAAEKLFIGCFREVQSSIRDSVHQLLSNQVHELELGHFYDVQRDQIVGKNGTLFRFAGLSKMTRDSIKSYEGIDIAWIEEAQSVKDRSWDILEPTIRKRGSEIWASWNPDLDTDDTYQKFIVNPSPEMCVVRVGWEDNPWRSEVLDATREHMRNTEPEKYRHVYGGECRATVDGAIYAQEVSALRQSGRLCNVPYDPMLRVHVIVDLGFADLMSLLLVQRLASEIRIIRYIEDRYRFIPSYSTELKGLDLNYGSVWLPHDGRANHVQGPSAEKQFRDLGWTVHIVPDIGIEQGIRKAREVFPRVYIDKDTQSKPSKTSGRSLINRLARYRRTVNSEGQATTPKHDDSSHGADGYRYLSIVADQLTNDGNTWGPDPNQRALDHWKAEQRRQSA